MKIYFLLKISFKRFFLLYMEVIRVSYIRLMLIKTKAPSSHKTQKILKSKISVNLYYKQFKTFLLYFMYSFSLYIFHRYARIFIHLPHQYLHFIHIINIYSYDIFLVHCLPSITYDM